MSIYSSFKFRDVRRLMFTVDFLYITEIFVLNLLKNQFKYKEFDELDGLAFTYFLL